jgi:hypothetical protein
MPAQGTVAHREAMHGRTTRTNARRLVGAVAIAGVLVPVLQGTASAKPGGPLRDGHWDGALAVSAVAGDAGNGGSVKLQSASAGELSLDVIGGASSGTYRIDVMTTATFIGTPGGSVDQVGIITGEIQGTASLPFLQPLSAEYVTKGTVGEHDVSGHMSASYTFGSDLVIVASSCSTASGTWAHPFGPAVVAEGMDAASIHGTWAATFTGANAPKTNAVLAGILTRGNAIYQSWLDTTAFDVDALEQLLTDAEMFAANAPVSDACTRRDQWASALAGMMRNLLAALSDSPSTSALLMRYGLAAGIRTATLPSIDGDGMEAALHGKMVTILDEAIALGNSFDIQQVLIGALSMGWSDIANKAGAAWKALQ